MRPIVRSAAAIAAVFMTAVAWGQTANKVPSDNTHEAMAAKLSGIQGYRPLFQRAFGSPDITIDAVAKAIATFERTLLSGNSPLRPL